MVTVSVNAQAYAQPAKRSSPSKSAAGAKQRMQSSLETGETVALSRDSLSRIKAILVVGPVEESTSAFIEETEEIASYLRGLGVQVKVFYDPAAKWNDIVRESAGAHIFFYSGHGSKMGVQGKAGGLCLSDGGMVSSATIIRDLTLHKNALVLFAKVCMGAGSSAGDDSDIGVAEAVERVSNYALPFVRIGAAGYYANNYYHSMLPFLRGFFNKKNLKQVYSETASRYSHIETFEKFSYSPRLEVSVASCDHEGFSTRTTYTNGVKRVEQVPLFKNYDVAYVGIPGFTVLDFFR